MSWGREEVFRYSVGGLSCRDRLRNARCIWAGLPRTAERTNQAKLWDRGANIVSATQTRVTPLVVQARSCATVFSEAHSRRSAVNSIPSTTSPQPSYVSIQYSG